MVDCRLRHPGNAFVRGPNSSQHGLACSQTTEGLGVGDVDEGLSSLVDQFRFKPEQYLNQAISPCAGGLQSR